MRIFCVRASFCFSNQHTGLCGKYKAFYYFVLIWRAVCYEYTDDAMIYGEALLQLVLYASTCRKHSTTELITLPLQALIPGFACMQTVKFTFL